MIAAELAHRLGVDLGLESPEQIWNEIEVVAPGFSELTWAGVHDVEARDGVIVPLPRSRNGHAPEPIGEGDPDSAVAGVEPTTAGATEGVTQADPDAAAGDPGAATPTDADGAAADADADAPPPVPGRPGPASRCRPAPRATRCRSTPSRSGWSRSASSTTRARCCAHSPSLADIARPGDAAPPPRRLRRLGVAAGAELRVTSSRGPSLMPVAPDPAVPRGFAALVANAPGAKANSLVDGAAAVTDIRVERP